MSNCKNCEYLINEDAVFCPKCGKVVKRDSELTKKLKANFIKLIISISIYAAFLTFCLYENLSGVTFPFFVIGTILFYSYLMRILEIKIKFISKVYFCLMILISISMFLTADPFIHFFNYLCLFLLVIISISTNFYEEKEWDIWKYFLSGIKIFFGTIINIYRPFTDFKEFKKNQKEELGKKIYPVFIGLCISIPLLIFILYLLSTADLVFGNLFKIFFFESDFIWDVIKIVFLTVIVFLSTYGFITKLAKKDIDDKAYNIKNKEPLVAITFLSIIGVVYIAFSVIQVMYLFLGNLSLPDNYTYAQYAREGFFQLLFVSFINIVIVLICNMIFKNSKVLKILLSIISVCTYILIASSGFRMIMYIKVYELSKLRILVIWFLVLEVFLLAGLIINIFKEKFMLFRYVVIITSCVYMILAFARPDYLIAKYNSLTPGNFRYLLTLSEDVGFKIQEYAIKDVVLGGVLDDETAQSNLKRIANGEYKANFRNFNYSRYKNGKLWGSIISEDKRIENAEKDYKKLKKNIDDDTKVLISFKEPLNKTELDSILSGEKEVYMMYYAFKGSYSTNCSQYVSNEGESYEKTYQEFEENIHSSTLVNIKSTIERISFLENEMSMYDESTIKKSGIEKKINLKYELKEEFEELLYSIENEGLLIFGVKLNMNNSKILDIIKNENVMIVEIVDDKYSESYYPIREYLWE